MADYLGLVELGAIYYDNVAQKRPLNPIGTNNVGSDILTFSKDYTIGNTPSDTSKRLTWHKIKDGSKLLYICDRNIMAQISWDDLNARGYVVGKKVVIDGKTYICRLLTGGSNARTSENPHAGGTPINNEWDRFIGCEDTGLVGLKSDNATWNYKDIYTICKERYALDTTKITYRGHVLSKTFSAGSSAGRPANVGWRPVLELSNSDPTISGSDNDLGDKNDSFNIKYTVNDEDISDVLTITEKLDGIVTKTINSAVRNLEYVININTNSLTLGKHVIEIEVKDDKGLKSIRKHTFNVVKVDKYLIKQEDKYYSIKPEYYSLENKSFNSITLTASEPSKEEIKNFGFDDVGILNSVMTVGSETFRPIDVLDESFKVELYKV